MASGSYTHNAALVTKVKQDHTTVHETSWLTPCASFLQLEKGWWSSLHQRKPLC